MFLEDDMFRVTFRFRLYLEFELHLLTYMHIIFVQIMTTSNAVFWGNVLKGSCYGSHSLGSVISASLSVSAGHGMRELYNQELPNIITVS